VCLVQIGKVKSAANHKEGRVPHTGIITTDSF
jgi:hypothetical protein